MPVLQKRQSIFARPSEDAGSTVAVASAPSACPDAIDRRESPRIRQQCHAEVSPWINNRAGTAFTVVLDNVSTSGVGLLHSGRLEVGSRYLLEIPRPQERPLTAIFTVTRCDETDGGQFEVELAANDVLDVAYAISARRNAPAQRGSRWLVVGLVLAFAASAAAVFLNLI